MAAGGRPDRRAVARARLAGCGARGGFPHPVRGLAPALPGPRRAGDRLRAARRAFRGTGAGGALVDGAQAAPPDRMRPPGLLGPGLAGMPRRFRAADDPGGFRLELDARREPGARTAGRERALRRGRAKHGARRGRGRPLAAAGSAGILSHADTAARQHAARRTAGGPPPGRAQLPCCRRRTPHRTRPRALRRAPGSLIPPWPRGRGRSARAAWRCSGRIPTRGPGAAAAARCCRWRWRRRTQGAPGASAAFPAPCRRSCSPPVGRCAAGDGGRGARASAAVAGSPGGLDGCARRFRDRRPRAPVGRPGDSAALALSILRPLGAGGGWALDGSPCAARGAEWRTLPAP